MPVVSIIRERGLLQDFPDRTETDMYLWLAEHRAELEEALGWDVAPDRAAEDLVWQRSPAPQRVLARVSEKILDAFTPDDLEPGPAPGEWRVGDVSKRRDRRLFPEVLVAIDGQEAGWRALEQAIIVAGREGGLLRGLHVVRDETARREQEGTVQALHERFQWRMGEVGIDARLVVESGQVPQVVCDRARWNDLVVMPLTHPPGEKVMDRLSSGFRSIVQRCPRPILAVPGGPAPLQRALLAYDGSAKADEALFVTAYLGCRWNSDVVVLTVEESGVDGPEAVSRARDYLQGHDINTIHEIRSGNVPANILEVAQAHSCDFIVMGGYGKQPVMEIVLGSSLNRVLRESAVPILICR
jgi:nucleotide-binding universal stress UspA family protein